MSAKRSKRLERMRRVGAQRPTKMPKRSAWAVVSGVLRSRKNQMPMEPRIETTPVMKQKVERERHMWGFIMDEAWGGASRSATPELSTRARGLASAGEELRGQTVAWAWVERGDRDQILRRRRGVGARHSARSGLFRRA